MHIKDAEYKSQTILPAGEGEGKIGEIIDNPKNRADADYKIAVLNALKKMDKSMTMQELNEKLTKTVAEPDATSADNDDDLDV